MPKKKQPVILKYWAAIALSFSLCAMLATPVVVYYQLVLDDLASKLAASGLTIDSYSASVQARTDKVAALRSQVEAADVVIDRLRAERARMYYYACIQRGVASECFKQPAQ